MQVLAPLLIVAVSVRHGHLPDLHPERLRKAHVRAEAEVFVEGLLERHLPAEYAAADHRRPVHDPGTRRDRPDLCVLLPRREALLARGHLAAADLLCRLRHCQWSVLGHLGRKIGKHRAAQVGGVAYAVAQSTLMALPAMGVKYTATDAIPTAIGMFFAGFCASAFMPLVRAMVADVVDEVRLETGQDLTEPDVFDGHHDHQGRQRRSTSTLAYGILACFGYSGKTGAVHNTPRGILGLELVYLIAPVALVWLGCAMFFGYKLDAKRHAEISKALATREGIVIDVAAAEEALVAPKGRKRPKRPADRLQTLISGRLH